MNQKEQFRKALVLIHVWIMLSFLKSMNVRAQSCSTGYFSQNGVWTKCESSWYTCTNETEWETCYNKILNNLTKLWEFWPYGQYYSAQTDLWSDWKGSWRNEWGYQSEWYVCPTGMIFDLTLFKWVNNCTSTQVYINDPLLRSIPVWRDTVYYVDPASLQPIELGTK